MKTIVVNALKCTGCRLCQMACATSRSHRMLSDMAHLKVLKEDHFGLAVPIACAQCKIAPCQNVCPMGAIRRNEDTGALGVDEARCIGCQMCSMVCPLGMISYHEQVASKCDLCGGEPVCVQFCATGAIRYEDVESVAQFKNQKLAEEQFGLLKKLLFDSI